VARPWLRWDGVPCHLKAATDTHRASGGAHLRPRGFTVLEMMVVIGIASVMVAMSAGAYEQLTAKANFSGVLGNLVTNLRRTRMEAAGRGVATAFVIDVANNRWWGIEAPVGWSVATFDPANPGTLIVSGTFPTGSGKTVFGPPDGYGAALAPPFATVPVITTQNPSLPYCSFCDPRLGLGAIIFQPTGAASFSGAAVSATAQGQQFTVQSASDSRTVLLAVTGRTGLIEVFER
jgi:prepilin-type N-terminal cleavage/methylation domain-containing protein